MKNTINIVLITHLISAFVAIELFRFFQFSWCPEHLPLIPSSPSCRLPPSSSPLLPSPWAMLPQVRNFRLLATQNLAQDHTLADTDLAYSICSPQLHRRQGKRSLRQRWNRMQRRQQGWRMRPFRPLRSGNPSQRGLRPQPRQDRGYLHCRRTNWYPVKCLCQGLEREFRGSEFWGTNLSR